MSADWMTTEYLLNQEKIVREETETFYSKNRGGFCDYALDGVDLMIQGIGYLRNINKDSLDEKDKNKKE